MDNDVINLHDDGPPWLIRLSQVQRVTPPDDGMTRWRISFSHGNDLELPVDLANKITTRFGWEIPQP